MIVNQLTITHN